MKKSALIIASSLLLFACGEATTDADHENEVVHEEEEQQEVEPQAKAEMKDFILGKWLQIGKSCDSNGENCEPMAKESTWEFRADSVTWSKFTLDYLVRNDTILISGSPYAVASDWKDTITFHAVKTNRYMKLVRLSE
ncbi:MAG: hypothetical protein EP338_11865 [Bacteroidetes bacterium]|nr:MAG: hypothetical protein EP338_11865 [Bacteroidota bacterium]